MSEPRFRCQPASVARGDERLGTASTVKRWLLIEQSGPWGRDALEDSRLSAEVSARLKKLSRRVRARPILIKRSGRYQQMGARVHVATTGGRAPWIEALDLPGVDALFDWDLSPLERGESVGGRRLERPVFLVCTHGRHDACCAQYGRPVALALAERPDRDVWECSHVGGDRFAGNLVCFPHGLYFGHLRPDTAERAAQLYEHGRIDLEHYRGRSAYAFAVQAAEGHLRRQLAEDHIERLVLLRQERLDASHLRATFRHADRTDYQLDVRQTHSREPIRLTCQAKAEAHYPVYEVCELRQLPASEHPADG